MDQMNLTAWAGRMVTDEGGVTEAVARRVHATFGIGPAPSNGDPLPQLWHWHGFLPSIALDELGTDGHPADDGFLPPVRLKRRMWAGGSLRFLSPLRVGDPLRRRSAIRDVTEKTGAAGPMVFVTVDHAIYGPNGLAIEERQDIVYLEMPTAFTPPKKRPQYGRKLDQREMSETLLFRYSALTFNAHRIHYDKPYATEVEKYPGLVVHGPLQAALIMQAATREKGRPPSLFDFRSVHPMFAGTRLEICAEETNPAALTLTTGQGGHQGLTATAIWEETL